VDDLIDIRLFREENQAWIEKAIITRIWISTTDSLANNMLEQLQELLDTVSRNTQALLSAPATHAAQTVSDSLGPSTQEVLIEDGSCSGSASNWHQVRNSSLPPKPGVEFACTLSSTKLALKISRELQGE
jgi:hypothetical protein